MSELRMALSAVESLEAQVEALRAHSLALRNRDHTLEEMLPLQAELTAVEAAASDGSEMHAMMTKFRERSAMMDPITNEPRFGPKTMSKVLDMLQRFDAIREELLEGELVPALQAAIAAQHERIEEEERCQQARAQQERDRQREEELAAVTRQQELKAEANRQRQLADEAERIRLAELARQAQERRRAREQERLNEKVRIQQEQEELARRNASAVVGVSALQDALAGLQTELDASTYSQVLEKLHVLVANICSSPENAAFRHIPLENPHFHADIGQHANGYSCMRALGFKELEPELGKRVFIMEEPDLGADMDKWSNWFDQLKEMRDAIAEKLV